MVNFKTLWTVFPTKGIMEEKCINKQPTGSHPFGNYCAIMLSEALIRSGVTLNGYKGNKCWSHLGMKHALLAEELAEFLISSKPPWLRNMQKISPATFQSDLKDKTGVIFFKDYWQRGKESFENRSGDHVDLWNGERITSGTMLYRSIIEFVGFVSDLNKSKEIWFWEVK